MKNFIFDSPITNMFSTIHENLFEITKKTNEINEGDYVFLHKTFKGEQEAHWFHDEKMIIDSSIQKQQNLVNISRDAKHALEIGFNAGHSSAIMLNYNRNMTLTVIDICEHTYTEPCFEYMKSIYGDRIHLIKGDSLDILPTLSNSFDFIHIDGSHEISHVENDLVNCNKLLQKSGIILLDDTQDTKIKEMGDHVLNKYIKVNLTCLDPLKHEGYIKVY